MRLFAPVISLCFLISCTPGNSRLVDDTNTGMYAYVPVYAERGASQDVSVGEIMLTEKAGKIYAYGRYIFQNELNQGIHVIDNSDNQHPQKVAFIRIPYNTEMAVRGSYLYANSIHDLLVLDMHNPLEPVVVRTIKNAFPLIHQSYPPEQGYFVCADPAKGIVVDWELQVVQNAACRR